jgi:hypothetical protein
MIGRGWSITIPIDLPIRAEWHLEHVNKSVLGQLRSIGIDTFAAALTPDADYLLVVVGLEEVPHPQNTSEGQLKNVVIQLLGMLIDCRALPTSFDLRAPFQATWNDPGRSKTDGH